VGQRVLEEVGFTIMQALFSSLCRPCKRESFIIVSRIANPTYISLARTLCELLNLGYQHKHPDRMR